MTLTFLQLPPYVADARRLKMTDNDQRTIEQELLRSPEVGQAMSGTGGLRKMRYSPAHSSRGKSGGVRICYVLFPRYQHLFFVSVFAKNEQANLNAAEKRAIRTLITEIELELHRRFS
jgi:hypothetical protein